MEITRNVILDLMPLYVADEVSADTKTLVEEYLEADPELAKVAKRLEPLEKPKPVPVALSQDAQMEAYRKARQWQILIALIIAAGISILAITVFIFFLVPA